MLDRQDVLTKLMHAREDIDLVIDSVLQGDTLCFNWTRLLAHSVNNHLVHIFFAMESFAQVEASRSPEQLPLYLNTLRDLAERIHKGLLSEMRFARVWGPSAFDGQAVQRDHVLAEGDVVEIHT